MSDSKGTPAHDRYTDVRDDAVFKALANSTRRRILDILRQDPRSTGEVCEAFPHLDRTTVLQHIRVLEHAELLTGRRIGKSRQLALAPLPIKRIHDRWIGEYTRAAVGLLADLDDQSPPPETAGAMRESRLTVNGEASAESMTAPRRAEAAAHTGGTSNCLRDR
ncbi:MAG: ArsR/SmtB family transcription factor [Brevibacterium linens]